MDGQKRLLLSPDAHEAIRCFAPVMAMFAGILFCMCLSEGGSQMGWPRMLLLLTGVVLYFAYGLGMFIVKKSFEHALAVHFWNYGPLEANRVIDLEYGGLLRVWDRLQFGLGGMELFVLSLFAAYYLR